MLKILFIFGFIALGFLAAQRLDDKSQKKIAIIVGVLFVLLAVAMILKELLR